MRDPEAAKCPECNWRMAYRSVIDTFVCINHECKEYQHSKDPRGEDGGN
jgi:hypothetical protein